MAGVLISDLHRKVLTDTKADLCVRIKSEGSLITELESAGVITPEEAEVVRAEKVSHVRAGCIIEHVRKGTEKGFESFLHVLEHTNHAHLAKHIRDACGMLLHILNGCFIHVYINMLANNTSRCSAKILLPQSNRFIFQQMHQLCRRIGRKTTIQQSQPKKLHLQLLVKISGCQLTYFISNATMCQKTL